MLDTYDHEGWCIIIFSCIDRCVMKPSCVALSILITPTPRWLGYAWCVWSRRLMQDNLFFYWSMCNVCKFWLGDWQHLIDLSLINYLYTTPLNQWLLRCTTAVVVFAMKVKQRYLHRVILWSKALVFVHCDGCTNVTLSWITILHVERKLWFSITLNRM